MKTCILYGRVSSRRQAETFSLPTQFRALREWADANGYEVVAEVADEGGKDSKRDVFDGPGVERIFDLCESRHVDVVVAQERSRFGEYPVPEMIAYRDRLAHRADAWNNLLAEHPGLPEYVIPWEKLPPEVRERMTGPMPWDNDPFAWAQVAALAEATPEQQRERYASLELRVVAHSKD